MPRFDTRDLPQQKRLLQLHQQIPVQRCHMIFVTNESIHGEQWTYRGKEGRAYTVALLSGNYQMGPYSSVQVIEEDVQAQQLFLHHYLDSQFPCLGVQALGAQLSVADVDNCA